jgi:hypothetical protein
MSQSNHVIGSEAPRFVEFLIERLVEIETIKLFHATPSDPVQDDVSISPTEQARISRALVIREQLKLPFWDSLLLDLSNHPGDAPNVLRRAVRHNPQDLNSFVLHRSDVTEATLRRTIAALPGGSTLAMSSRVATTKGEVRHLPMVDFHCAACAANDHLVRAVLKELGLPGYVAKSGRSYHFYGCTLVDEAFMMNFLARALLFGPIIDRAWIAHQLIERACGLRISFGKEYATSPQIAFEV